MKKKKSMSALAMVCLLGIAGSSFATTYSDSPNSQAIPAHPSAADANSNATGVSPNTAPSLQSFMGSVQSIDNVNKTVQLKDDSGQIQTFKVGSNTQLTRGGESVQLSEVKLGDQLIVKSNTSPSM